MHPVLFTVFGEPIHAYTAFTALGYFLGVVFGVRVGLKDGRDIIDLLELGVVVVLSALLGSKLFHALFEAEGHHLSNGKLARGVVDLFQDDPWHWARLFEAGYVFYGGVVVAAGITWLFAKRRGHKDPGAIGDYAVPGLVFGTFIGRIGCFLAGCCHGAASSVPWAVIFPSGHPSGSVPVHPVQLYDSAFGLMGVIAYIAFAKKKRFGGEVMCAYAFAYACFRFGTEMFRADADRGIWFAGLSTSQCVALLSLPLIALIWWRALKAARAAPRVVSEPS